MASITALSAISVPPAIQRSNGHEHTAAVARPVSLFSFNNSKFLIGAEELRSGNRKFQVTYSRVKTAAATLTADAPSSKNETSKSDLKSELLSIVAGLDRGLLASSTDETAADIAARKLEQIGDPVELPRDLDLLQGRWRLVYTSGFVTGSLGGQRPGPPLGSLLPLNLGQVYQRIDVTTRELDNIVDLRISTPWPLPSLEATATLAHIFELTGGNGIRIVFTKTTVKPSGSLSQLPSFDTPPLPDFLRQSSNVRGVVLTPPTWIRISASAEGIVESCAFLFGLEHMIRREFGNVAEIN